MTITFYDEKTKKQYGSFTAASRNGLFTYAQKMKIASLRIKLLETLKENSDQVMVMIVMDSVSEPELRKAFQ